MVRDSLHGGERFYLRNESRPTNTPQLSPARGPDRPTAAPAVTTPTLRTRSRNLVQAPAAPRLGPTLRWRRHSLTACVLLDRRKLFPATLCGTACAWGHLPAWI